MRIFKLSVLFFSIFLMSLSVSHAQNSYSGIDPGAVARSNSSAETAARNLLVNNGVTFFINEEQTFVGACGFLPTEDFEDTNVAPGDIESCPGPFNSFTDNACYSPGALIPDFSIFATGDGLQQMAVITPPEAGITKVGVGPDDFIDDTNIIFDPPVTSASMVIVTPISSGPLDINVFGLEDQLLGSTTINTPPSPVGTFVGIATTDQITSIVIDGDGSNNAELLYELSFGQCDPSIRNVPTLSEWGLIAMAGILGLVGFMVIRRRQAVA